MRLLTIDDDEEMREIFEGCFYEYFEVLKAEDGIKGLEIIEKQKPEIVLLDLYLPNMNGMKICQEIKSNKVKYGDPIVIMVTGETEQKYVLDSLRVKADDYIKKPFDIEEIVLRVRNFSERIKKKNILNYKNIELDLDGFNIKVDGKEIVLSDLQYNLLVYFIMNKGIVLSKFKIYEKVWGKCEFDSSETDAVKFCLSKLKNKIKVIKDNIISKRGLGYILKSDK